MRMKLAGVALAALMGIAAWSPSALADNTLVVAQEAEPVGLDLMRSSIQTTMSVSYNIHDTLFRPQGDASIRPALAKTWKQLDDRTWRVTLREDATFHDGTPVTAEAVKFSFNRIMSDALNSPNRGKLSAFDKVEVVDDRTVRISTKEPYAPGLYMLAYYLPIVPPHAVKEMGDEQYNVDPVGSGPYRLEEWKKGQEVVLKAYDDYYGPKPAYDTVTFRSIPEPEARVAALLTGEVDVISGIAYHQRERIRKSDNAHLTDQMGVMPYLGLNTYEAPFDDKRVRQAVNYAINRKLIVDALFDGEAILAEGVISPRTFGAAPDLEPYPYDPDKAKQLLKEAGHGDGLQARLAYPTYMTQIQQQAEIIQAQLAKVGIDVKLEPFERAVMWDRYKAQKHQMYIYWWDDAPEPDRYVYPLLHSESRDYYYKNPEVDKLLDKGRRTLDREARAKVYHEVDHVLYEDAPWAFLYIIPDVFGVANDVDYEGRRDGFLDMRSAKPSSN
ncbi:ABC transporter substrate-binding protein [Ferruginivarius sediminum]|uniref:ABC transporter substrate-binding protein n=1 Tax=Ferruginivarius sediminum TaxID=2661937 RepID=A0A369TLQ2_9PROT|nr:ABC transporter substrate-binding protein [Ferruginivarius sediminum]RDD63836.1 ABC transporter substrate-binding protein [Ferruginivarius sediminum]